MHRAPFYNFSIETLPPLTLFDLVVLRHALRVEVLVDAVVLRHALRIGQAGSEQNFVLAVWSSGIDLPEF